MKKNMFIAFLASAFFLSGCAKAVDLTEEENNLVAEYAAGVLIDRSYYVENKYIEETTVETTSIEESTSGDTPIIDPSETSVVEETTTETNNFDIAKELGVEGLKITYIGYSVVNEYPDDPDAMFTFQSEPGFQFLVIDFEMTNNSDADITVNTAADLPVFQADFNGDYQYNNYGSLLTNDLSNLKDVSIKSGESFQSVLIFMVRESVLTNLDDSKITIKLSGSNDMITIIK